MAVTTASMARSASTKGFRCDRERLMSPDLADSCDGSSICLNWQPMSVDDPRRVKSYQGILCGTKTLP